MSNPWNDEYSSLIEKMKKLPWESKPKIMRSSAITEWVGKIGNRDISFSFHIPHKKWGNAWSFLGLLYTEPDSPHKFNEIFNTSGNKIRDVYPDIPEKLQKENLEDFEYAIRAVKYANDVQK